MILLDAMQKSYDNEVTDEFMKPIVVTDKNGEAIGKLKEGDVVVFFNFRNDRAKELTIALTQKDLPEFGMKTIPLYYCTMTPYDATFKGLHIIYPKENADNTIGEILSCCRKNTAQDCRNRKICTCDFFLFRRTRGSV